MKTTVEDSLGAYGAAAFVLKHVNNKDLVQIVQAELRRREIPVRVFDREAAEVEVRILFGITAHDPRYDEFVDRLYDSKAWKDIPYQSHSVMRDAAEDVLGEKEEV